jgi:hypothetical protein
MANNPTVTEKAYNRLRQQTAKQLGEPVTSDRVKLVVMLRLQQEAILIRQLRGEPVATAETVAINEAITPHLPKLKGTSLRVTFVDGAQGHFKCQHCGKDNEKPIIATPAAFPVPAPAENAPVKPASLVDSVPGGVRMTYPKPPEPPAPRHDPGSIHDAAVTLADGTVIRPPLKRWQGPDLRRPAPPDNPAAPFGDNRTISQAMRTIDKAYS